MVRISREEMRKEALTQYNEFRSSLDHWESKTAYDQALRYALIELHREAAYTINEDEYNGLKKAISTVEGVLYGHD